MTCVVSGNWSGIRGGVTRSAFFGVAGVAETQRDGKRRRTDTIVTGDFHLRKRRSPMSDIPYWLYRVVAISQGLIGNIRERIRLNRCQASHNSRAVKFLFTSLFACGSGLGSSGSNWAHYEKSWITIRKGEKVWPTPGTQSTAFPGCHARVHSACTQQFSCRQLD